MNTARHVDNALTTANTKKAMFTYSKYWLTSTGSFSVTTFFPSKREM